MNIQPCYFAACLAITWSLLLPSDGLAQIRLGPKGPYEVKKEEKPAEPIGAKSIQPRGEARLSRVRLHAATEPDPALKYSFVPDYRDLKPGNAAQYYYRALLQHGRVRKETQEKLNAMFDLPVADIETETADEFLTEFSHVFHNLEIATHREQCDWQWRVRDLEGPEQIQFILQEIQDMRNLGRLLSLKAGNHLAKNEFEQAVDTLTIGYRIAKDVSQPKFLVNDLVGIAIANMMNDRVVEMIDMPDSPNLYWAISSLPRPLISMRNSFEHEKSLPYSFFSFLRDPETTQRSADEWRRLVESELKVFQQAAGGWGAEDKLLSNPAAMVAAVYPRAKRELIAEGFNKERMEKMPVAQVVAIHESRELKRITDSIFKWALLPYYEAENLADKASIQFGRYSPFAQSGESLPIGNLLLPAVASASQAEIRLQTQIDGIRVIEAIRMQMAADDGTVPKRLEDITVVPVPRNPSTNEPFSFQDNVLELKPGKNPSVAIIWRVELQSSDK